MQDTATQIEEPTTEIDVRPAARFIKILKSLRWGAFAFFCLVFFTLVKFPDAKVKAWIQTSLNNELSNHGMSLSAQKTSLSTVFGLKYIMEDAVLVLPAPQPTVKIQKISVSPSLFSLLLSKLGASIYVKMPNGGSFDGTFSMKPDPKTGSGPMSIDASMKDLNIGKLGILGLFTEFKASATATGNIELNFDPLKPNTSDGKVQLKLSQIQSEPQTVSGFNLPSLNISQGNIQATINNGTLKIGEFQLGKPSSADDLIAKLTGELNLGRTIDASQMKLNAKFSISQNVLKSFSILETLMAQAKQSDGSFSYDLHGSFAAPDFAPAGSSH